MRPALSLLELLVLAAGWAFAGYALLPARRRSDDPFLVWSTALALGAGATAVALTILAAAQLLGAASVALVATGVTALAVVGCRRAVGARALAWKPLPRGTAARAALFVLVTSLALGLFVTLAPPSSMDATVYHLTVPRAFLRAHTWARLDTVQSFQPLYVEMLMAEGLVVGGGSLAALAHWALGLGAIGSAAAWGRRLGGGGLWPAVIFGGTALFVWESTSAFIDLGLALFTSLALLWAAHPEPDGDAAVLAGLLGGLAAGTKFTGLAGASLAGVVGFVALWPNRAAGAKRFVTIAALAMLLAAPWYVRNVLLTGNPIFPLANPRFGLPAVPLAGIDYGYGRSPLALVTSGFDLIARGDPFDQGWSMGPAYLALAPIGLAVTARRRLGKLAAGAVVCWWLFWFYSSPQTRLLLPVLPIAAGLAGAGMTRLFTWPSRLLQAAGLAVVAIALAGAVGTAALAAKLYAPVVLGREPVSAFLARNSWNFTAFEQVNRRVPADARVAVQGANNLFYLDRAAHIVGDDLTDDALRSRGFTHRLELKACPIPATTPGARTVWEGAYALRASRLRGGSAAERCARLTALGPAAAH